MFYHISRKNLGLQINLEPRVPDSCDLSEEGDIPHICVSTSPYHCLRSILGVSSKDFHVLNLLEVFRDDLIGMETIEEWLEKKATISSPSVYISHEKAFIPPNSSDFRFNKEHWYIKPTSFNLQGYLHLETLISSGKIKIVESHQKLDGSNIMNINLKNIKVKIS